MKNKFVYAKKFAVAAIALFAAYVVLPRDIAGFLFIVGSFVGALAVGIGIIEVIEFLDQPKDEHDLAHKSGLR